MATNPTRMDEGTMSVDAVQTTEVDPQEVDWRRIFREHAGSVSGELDMLERSLAVQDFVAKIGNEEAAERLIGDAVECGILESHGDAIRLADVDHDDSAVDPHEVDWPAVFTGVTGDVTGKFPTNSQGTRIQMYSDVVSTPQEGQRVWEAAKDCGIIQRKGPEDGFDTSGFRLADPPVPDTPEPEEPEESQERHEAVQELRDASDSEEEYVESLEHLVGDLLDRVKKVENRQDAIFENHQQQRTGLTEMQVKRLKQGEVLSRDGVDEHTLQNDLGLELIFVGEDNDMVRLKDRHQEDATEATGTKMPNFDALCKLEEVRMKELLGVRSRDDIENESKNLYRAMAVWDDAEMLDTTDNSDTISIPSSKVKQKLERICDNISESSLNTTTKRVMVKVEDGSDGVFTLEKGNTNRLTTETDALNDAKISRFQKQSMDGGDNTVVTDAEGVSVTGQGDSP